MAALLEVIVLGPEDAEAAEAGGAHRLELISHPEQDGLTPTAEVMTRIRQHTSLPVRVMLRNVNSFTTDSDGLSTLAAQAESLASAGADGFVFGFLTPTGVDVDSVGRLTAALSGRPWTFHRAIDHAPDADAAWQLLGEFSGLDTVLTSGAPDGVAAGVDALARRVAADAFAATAVMAGGGLREEHIPVLAASGIRQFHVGSAVRADGTWDTPVDAGRVARWRSLVDGASSTG